MIDTSETGAVMRTGQEDESAEAVRYVVKLGLDAEIAAAKAIAEAGEKRRTLLLLRRLGLDDRFAAGLRMVPR